MSTEISEQQLILELDGLSKQLINVLKAETVAMKQRDLDALSTLGSQKTVLLNRLQECNEFLSELFIRTPVSQETETLKQQLRECHSLNRDNRTMATVELKHTQNSIELLRSLLKLDDVPLYGAYGEVTVSREKRNLGVV